MELSAEQKNMVATFLRRQDELFAELPADVRVRALSTVKTRVRDELLGFGGDSVSDDQVESLLKRMKVSVRPKQDGDALDGVDGSQNGNDFVPDDGVASKAANEEDVNLKVTPREWKQEVKNGQDKKKATKNERRSRQSKTNYRWKDGAQKRWWTTNT